MATSQPTSEQAVKDVVDKCRVQLSQLYGVVAQEQQRKLQRWWVMHTDQRWGMNSPSANHQATSTTPLCQSVSMPKCFYAFMMKSTNTVTTTVQPCSVLCATCECLSVLCRQEEEPMLE